MSTPLHCPSCGLLVEDRTLKFCPDDGSVLVEGAGAELSEGAVVGPYRVLRRLGSGGMGTVYEARHEVMDRLVALKVLRTDMVADPTVAQRFRRESKAASRIDHPNVVRVYDFGTNEGLSFMAMELLSGETLADRILRDGALAPSDAVAIAASIVDGLCAAHDAGIVHRDLKPANVMLTKDRGVKVLDLGVARLLDHPASDDARLTRAGAVVGTPAYMSPEGARRSQVGPPADLYSLGVVLFEMLVGRVPFDDPDSVMVLGMHLRLSPELVREARPGLEIPDALEKLVDRLLSKDPEARPTSGEARDELAALRDAGQLAERTSGRAIERAAQLAPTRRSRRTAGGFVFGGVALMSLIAWVALRAPQEPRVWVRPPLRAPIVRREPEPVPAPQVHAVIDPIDASVPEVPSPRRARARSRPHGLIDRLDIPPPPSEAP